LFIRGDDAITLLAELRRVDRLLREKCQTVLPWKLAEIAEIIERDVIVRGGPNA
jgi:hypothetical protein